MSWQDYVSTNLVGSGMCKKAAIIGLDGGMWADGGSGLQGTEGAAVAKLFQDPGSAFASGIRVGGTKYLCIKADERSIYGKKGAGGVVCVKTNMAVLIGIYDETVQPGQCTATVEKLADYLLENNY
eukprot:CAMPEP_0198310286 /NCGR_PEP_ID=MMETSP1450-20131203/2407_1 /TAXON_ID=753684 ORGANISM="Madagascaria erythrocladiodes, Strain CCMP3234" /NCGR_SAMPLE_ID=MMETSP1450 /ASSEMBLY_ACC=CAM_ASM_001115 /LENGTH=125 /DNA_ID=CAMNT_0044013103 /DNA_START=72 /DNA_END=449 /DNA_ORIENTATION=-